MRCFLLGPFSSPFPPVRIRPGWVASLGPEAGQHSRGGSSLPGERGQCILSTPPKILFCDLRLDPGESKSCESCLLFPCSEGLPLGNSALKAGFAELSAASGRPWCLRKVRCFGGSVSAKELLHRPESVLHCMRTAYCRVSLGAAPGPHPLLQVCCVAARHKMF